MTHEKQVLLLICALHIAAQGDAGQQKGKNLGCCSRHHLKIKFTHGGQYNGKIHLR